MKLYGKTHNNHVTQWSTTYVQRGSLLVKSVNYRLPEYMSDRMPRMPEIMPDRMPDRMPEYLPDTMPEYIPDRMPE